MRELYLPIPEIKFPVAAMRDWGFRNRQHFRHAREDEKTGLNGCIVPHRFAKMLNDQVHLDPNIYNYGIELFRLGHLYLVDETYPMHTDPRRDAALNFLLCGSSVTMWEDGTTCPYQIGQAMLFNTQVPHAVFVEGEGERMMISFTVTMGFDRFVNLYRSGIIFNSRNRILHISEITPAKV